MTEKQWLAEKRAMEALDASLTGRKIIVRDVQNYGDLGYTSMGDTIHVAKNHEWYKTMTEEDSIAFRYGINVHEVLHQVFTNFEYFYRRLEKLKTTLEKYMFAEIFNLIEDPAIENFADQVVGGHALNSLYFVIDTAYKKFKEPEPTDEEIRTNQFILCEYLNALVQFGDRGLIKGGFKSEKAQYYFNKTAPTVYKAINEPDGKKRVDLALQVFEMTQVLWKTGHPATTMQMVNEFNRKHKKNHSEGSGSGMTASQADDRRNQNRKKTMEKQEKLAEENLKREAGMSDNTNTDNHSSNESSNEKNGKRNQKPNSSCEDSSSSSKDNSQNDDKKNEKSLSENKRFSGANNKDCDKHEDGSKQKSETSDMGLTQKDAEEVPPSAEEEVGDSEPENPLFDYDKNVGEQLSSMLDRYMKDMATEDTKESSEQAESMLREICEEHKQFSFVNEKNVIPTFIPENLETAYEAMLGIASPVIAPLITQLKKIFIDDKGSRAYAGSGRVSMKRATSGKVTTRLFEKRIFPGDKADMCIFLLMDMSGSMNGEKDSAAKLTAIILSEVFAYFKIPVYCMSFQHIRTVDAFHTHMVRWKNTRSERISLLTVAPAGSNFDSYSIRHATALLKRRNERHKLLCVISDGLPSHFFSGPEGIRQNKMAIDDARYLGIDVFGAGIGRVSKQDFESMYGKDFFINIESPENLADQMAGLVRKVVKGW